MSWFQLLDILHESVQEIRDERRRPPEACPDCGEPLRSGSDGTLHCRFDGYRWPQDGR